MMKEFLPVGREIAGVVLESEYTNSIVFLKPLALENEISKSVNIT